MRIFCDTNVLVYAVDPRDTRKQRLAQHLMEAHGFDLTISTQVLLEYYSACAGRLGLSTDKTRASLTHLTRLSVATTDTASVLDASDIVDETGLSIYDAMIVEAAKRTHCDALYTEDAKILNADPGIRVENPFA